MKKLTVALPARGHSYDILIGHGLLKDQQLIREKIPQKDVCIVSNEKVFGLYGQQLIQSLGDKRIISVLLGDGEEFKNLTSFEQILDKMLEQRFGRDCVVVALGGGVVGDIAGFAASAFQRGVACVQIPTTLLAQVDSSVGGKTGVNSPRGKNLIGAFHQPEAVIIDIDTLSTLEPREFAAGMAEVIKYALINDEEFLELLEKGREKLDLSAIIARCCANKAAIVAADEREKGQRALLNLGHTFGHALEMLTKYQRYKHGEAVSIGTVCALNLSLIREKISQKQLQNLISLFKQYELPTVVPENLSSEKIYQAMLGDKKVKDGKLRLVLQSSFCNCELVADANKEEIIKAIEASRV